MQRRQFDLTSRPGAAPAALAALAGAALVAGCGRVQGPATSFDLQQSLAAATRCHVSVSDPAALETVRARIARHTLAPWTFEVELQGDSRPMVDNEPRIWIGTSKSPGCEIALAQLGVERSADGFRFLGQDFQGRSDGLIATVGDPERAGAVLEIVLGNDLRVALNWIADWTPTSRLGWQVFRGGAIHGEGLLDPSGAALSLEQINVAALEAELSKDAQHGERADFDWTAPTDFDPTADEDWLAGLDRAVAGVRQRLASITPFDALWRVSLGVFETPEALARVCRARGWAHLRRLEPQAQLALVHVAGWPDNGAFELARASALLSAGEPAAAWLLDGLAAASADSWFGRSQGAWLAHLWTGDLVPSVEQLAQDDKTLSPHVARPMRGALFACCEETGGADFAARHWTADPEKLELPSDDVFRAWLERRLGNELEPARGARAQRREAARARATRRGACLVASPPKSDPLGGGFGSRACEASLAQLRKLGASAVALSWCSALEASEPRVFGSGPLTWTQADDAALFATILRARQLEMSVVLLPQLVATQNGGWAGQVMLTTPRAQRELFQAWRSFMINIGLLAELAGVDVLSLGTEAPDTAVTRVSKQNHRTAEDLARLRSDWQYLIESSRGAFPGALTYAARWDGEAQGIEFWKDLDFLGQNVFTPFGAASGTGAPVASDFTQRIVGSFDHLKRLGSEHGVRPLICGIGISSTIDGWRQPSRPLGAVDLELQTRFYEGLARALQVGRKQELSPAGLFTWCWWSDPESGGDRDRGFTPQNKPAQAALGRALRVR